MGRTLHINNPCYRNSPPPPTVPACPQYWVRDRGPSASHPQREGPPPPSLRFCQFVRLLLFIAIINIHSSSCSICLDYKCKVYWLRGSFAILWFARETQESPLQDHQIFTLRTMKIIIKWLKYLIVVSSSTSYSHTFRFCVNPCPVSSNLQNNFEFARNFFKNKSIPCQNLH